MAIQSAAGSMAMRWRHSAVGEAVAAVPAAVRRQLGRERQEEPDPVATEVAALTLRVETLEAQVRELRGQHHRLAELTDVVQELLVPLSRRDQQAVDDILARYADELGS